MIEFHFLHKQVDMEILQLAIEPLRQPSYKLFFYREEKKEFPLEAVNHQQTTKLELKEPPTHAHFDLLR